MSGITSMRQRMPGQLVVDELLRRQDAMPPRSRVARFFGVSPLSAECDAWYRGAQGEIAVGRMLADLPPDWTVFHAIPVGTKGSDIDHIVLGPGGVFTVNTKHHSGKNIWVGSRTIMVSGQKQPYIRNSEYEASRVTTMIHKRLAHAPQARAEIALVDPKRITVRSRPERVSVVDARRLRRWLLKRPTILSQAEAHELDLLLDNPTT